ncbi:MAG: tyrosine-type recombinase/integrase [Bryobacterales bacterium]|nr:tyrosine-type recombinase/integrase [Bryobacterales bacterium]
MTDLIAMGPEELARQAREFAAESHAANTRRAYEADWRDFCGWCRERGVASCPAGEETVVLYLTDLARSRKVSTLTRRMAALGQAHRAAGHEAPGEMAGVRRLMRGIRRTKGTAPEAKRPVLIGDLKAMVKDLPETAAGLRDRALLLVGFAGAFRRSELVGLDVEDVEENGEGLVVRVRRGKTDQEGEGRKVGIPRGREEKSCPVRAVAAWIRAAGIESGPLFRPVSRHGLIAKTRLSGEAVALIVKRHARELGKDERLFAGHSLRAGLATSAAMAGKPERAIMNQTGHRSAATVRRYIRDGELFRENAAEGLGL